MIQLKIVPCYMERLDISLIANRGTILEKKGEFGYTHIFEHMCLLYDRFDENEVFYYDTNKMVKREEYGMRGYTDFDHMMLNIICEKNNDNQAKAIINLIYHIIKGDFLKTKLLIEAKEIVKKEIDILKDKNSIILDKIKFLFDGEIENLPIGNYGNIMELKQEEFNKYIIKYLRECDYFLVICGDINGGRIKEYFDNTFKEINSKSIFENQKFIAKNIKRNREENILYLSNQNPTKKLKLQMIFDIKHDLSTIYDRIVQIISDIVFEEILLKEEYIENVQITYKHIFNNRVLKSVEYKVKDKDILSYMKRRQFFWGIIQKYINNELIEKIKIDILDSFYPYFQEGINKNILIEEVKNAFLYNDAMLFIENSYEKIASIIKAVNANDIEIFLEKNLMSNYKIIVEKDSKKIKEVL